MRTKLIVLAVVLIAIAVALLFISRRDEPASAVIEEPATSVDADVTERPEFEDFDEAPTITPSPEGLYGDFQEAFERAGEKPDLRYEPIEKPVLRPPERPVESTTDDGGDDPPP